MKNEPLPLRPELLEFIRRRSHRAICSYRSIELCVEQAYIYGMQDAIDALDKTTPTPQRGA